MKKLLTLSLVVASLGASMVAPAQNFERQGMQLLSNITLSQLLGRPSSGSGLSGFTSPSGREYVMMGTSAGQVIVDITNPSVPTQIGRIALPNSIWHESAILGQYGYAGTEAGGGVRVIDLRNVDQGQVSLLTTFTGSGLDNIHTLQANPATNTVFLNGSSLGFVMLDVSNPAAPRISARWTTRYVHDCVPVSYTSGPYAGREIVFACCGSNGLYVLDITDRSNIRTLATFNYVADGYCHSAALSEDKRFLFVNDEFDELNGRRSSATTWVFNVEDIANPRLVNTFTNGGRYIDHNSSVKDGFLYLAAYRGGVRVYDIRNAPTMTEVGFFDTYPEGSGIDFSGAWGTFAGYGSGTVVVADINRGLFILDGSEAGGLGARPLGIRHERGREVSGSIVELRKSDDRYYVSESGPSPSANEPDNSRFIVNFASTITPRTSLDLTIEAKITRFSLGNTRVELKNWSTNQFVEVGRFDTNNVSDTTATFRGLSNAYISSTGQVEVRVRSFAEATGLRPRFNTEVDLLRVDVRR